MRNNYKLNVIPKMINSLIINHKWNWKILENHIEKEMESGTTLQKKEH